MSDEIATIDLGSSIKFEVIIHPLVALQILDFYYRRFGHAQQNPKVRVAGTLLGQVYTNKVHVTNCFAVPYEPAEEQGQFIADLQEHRTIYDIFTRANPDEVLLGAFVTGPCKLDIQVAYLTQEYSKKENYFQASTVLNQPIILQLDPTLSVNQFEMKAYRLSQNLKEFAGVASFNNLPVKVAFADESYQQVLPFIEKIDGPTSKDFKLVNTDNLEELKKQALKSIEKLQTYAKDVIEGNIEPNEELGRSLLKQLNELVSFKNDDFRKQFKNQVEESHLFQYLSNLASIQTIIGEKLTKL